MKVRDRLVVAVIAAVVLIAGMWLIIVSPERKQATTLSGQIASERQSLVSAQSQLASSRRAVRAYGFHVSQLDTAIRAIPTTAHEAELVATIARLAGTKVDFHSLAVSGANTGTGAQELSLSFTFYATYGNLQNFLAAIDALTEVDGTTLTAHGRLFTINSVSLTPSPPNSTTANISAVVYQQSGPIGPTGSAGASSTAAATS
jgi:Tfp pilus assembly protein PilO